MKSGHHFYLNRSLDILEHNRRLIESEMALVEKGLRTLVNAAGPEIKAVGDYVFNGTGKRIRPALFFIAAYSPGVNLKPLVNAATALELIHASSLLHDDVIDEAATRRGREAVRIRWSNKISILSGDYLLSSAFRMLADYRSWPLIDLIINVVRDMSEGEMEQAFSDPLHPNLEERYFQWIGKKSASFFAGCCKAGSLLGGENSDNQSDWHDFGYNLGIAFQLIDDLLDYTGSKVETGKPLYGDLNNRVLTLPLIRTLTVTGQAEPIELILQDRDASQRLMKSVAQAVLDGDGPSYTYHKAGEYAGRAKEALYRMEPLNLDKKQQLLQLVQDVLLRKK